MDNLKEQFLGFYKTPYLFSKPIQKMKLFEFDTIKITDIDFTKLQILEKIPLGKRVERFFLFYLQNSNRYTIIKNNIQVIHNKNTLGELDFLLFDKKEQNHIHVELVYKFYLYDNSFTDELDKYIGPNRDDTLIKKLQKLQNKQFPLLYNQLTQKYLTEINMDTINQQLCLFANIFLPKDVYRTNLPLINNQSVQGFYINYKEFNTDEYTKYEYNLPHRFDWVNSPNLNTQWSSHEKIQNEIQYFLDLKKSVLVWLKKEDNSLEKFFITWW